MIPIKDKYTKMFPNKERYNLLVWIFKEILFGRFERSHDMWGHMIRNLRFHLIFFYISWR